jgi:hypothetical protein
MELHSPYAGGGVFQHLAPALHLFIVPYAAIISRRRNTSNSFYKLLPTYLYFRTDRPIPLYMLKSERRIKMKNDKLTILWTNDNPITAEKMVLMYALNSMLNGWWKEVTVVLWGATAKLAAENELVRQKISIAMQAGVQFSACKACADQLEVTEQLTGLGIEVIYWGEGLTEILKEDGKLLTI